MTEPAGVTDQPDPIANDAPSAHDLVIQDMLQRKQFGLEKYGTLLQPGNGRKTLRDAYEEILDLAAYLRVAIYEAENPPPVSVFKDTVDKGTHEEECDYILINGGKDCIVCQRHIADHDCEDLMNLSGTCDMCGRRVI